MPELPMDEIDSINKNIDNRREPRFKTRLSAVITTKFDEKSTGIIANISLSGLQVCVNNQTMAKIMPNFKREDPSQAVSVQVEFSVPTSKDSIHEQKSVKVQANIVYIRRIHLDVFAIGCTFTNFLDDAQSALTDYIYYFGEPLH